MPICWRSFKFFKSIKSFVYKPKLTKDNLSNSANNLSAPCLSFSSSIAIYTTAFLAFPSKHIIIFSACVCVYVCMCVCVRPFTVKTSPVSISWNAREQINDVELKTFLSFAKFLHCYYRVKHLTFLTSHFILFTH